MNEKALRFIKNVVYAMGANISRIITTLLLTLLLPKVMKVEDYSYWQLYGFYGVYLTHSSIGWCEGTYLKYGGADYKALDGRKMASQFWGLMIYEGIFMAVTLCLFYPFLPEESKLQALELSLVYSWVYILRYQLQTVLQATNRISDYARIYTGERLANFFLVLVCILTGRLNFQSIAGAEIASNLGMLVYAVWICRRVTVRKLLPVREAFSETKQLIQIGYKLTLAGLANQLIIGVVRFAIEQRWGTVVFGKISLSFSMANMMITCIAAVSIVMFPMLRKVSRERLSDIYGTVRLCLTAPMFGVLAVYVPAKAVLELWLPQYRDSLRYLAILFPLCVYETRNMVLTWTYLKAIRRERDIMRSSLAMVALSFITTGFTVYCMDSLEAAVISIVALYGIKGIYTENLLIKHMEIRGELRSHLMEGALTAAFVFCSWTLPDIQAFFGYLAVYFLYLTIERKKIRDSIASLKRLIKS